MLCTFPGAQRLILDLGYGDSVLDLARMFCWARRQNTAVLVDLDLVGLDQVVLDLVDLDLVVMDQVGLDLVDLDLVRLELGSGAFAVAPGGPPVSPV